MYHAHYSVHGKLKGTLHREPLAVEPPIASKKLSWLIISINAGLLYADWSLIR